MIHTACVNAGVLSEVTITYDDTQSMCHCWGVTFRTTVTDRHTIRCQSGNPPDSSSCSCPRCCCSRCSPRTPPSDTRSHLDMYQRVPGSVKVTHNNSEPNTYARTHACACTHTHTHTCTHARTRAHTHTHARTHARTHAHTHTHTHTNETNKQQQQQPKRKVQV